jgi:addiction module HigA family antidote
VKASVKKLPPIHPGEILREEFMLPRGLSQNALARALNIPPRRINEIILEKRGITADTALRLARFFGTTAELWTGLQTDYELRLGHWNATWNRCLHWNWQWRKIIAGNP